MGKLIWADRVWETTHTAGTGNLTLSGAAASNLVPFANVMATGDFTWGFIADRGGPDWEINQLTMQSDGTLARANPPVQSSNGGALVNFSPGVKDVVLDQSSRRVQGAYSFFNVLDYGADPTGVSDSYPAFQAALDAIAALAGTSDPRGARLFVPYGEFKISQTLHITRCMVLEGASGNGISSGSRLRFPKNVLGIRVERYDTSSDGGAGDWSVIRDLGLNGSFDVNHDAPDDSHGIQMIARAKLENIFINGFSGHGVCIDSSLNPPGDANADLWQLNNCRIQYCGKHGLFVNGVDSNAGVATMVSSANNQLLGIFDSSFLGNTYIQCHVADNVGGGYGTEGIGNTVFYNCYDEGGEIGAINFIHGQFTLFHGGTHGAGFGPDSIQAQVIPSGNYITFVPAVRTTQTTQFNVPLYQQFGNRSGAIINTYGRGDENEYFAFGYGVANPGEWVWQYQAVVSVMAFADSHSVRGGGRVLFPTGLYLGSGGGDTLVGNGVAVPSSGSHFQGDMVINRGSDAGKPMGWVCTTAGTPGTFKVLAPAADYPYTVTGSRGGNAALASLLTALATAGIIVDTTS